MEITLGTVQFGLDYGVSNHTGKVSAPIIDDILAFAAKNNIHNLDTAAAYGDSESVISQYSNTFNIITKLPTLNNNTSSIIPYVEQSLARLQTPNVYGLLFHDINNVLNHPNKYHFFKELQQLKHSGIVKNIGASLYHPSQWQQLKAIIELDLLQVPINIFDQRFLETTLIDDFYQHNIKLHCRSIFLQGLLLMPLNEWPEYFKAFKSQLMHFHELAKKLNCSLLALALSVLVQNLLKNKGIQKVIKQVVIGCCSKKQLSEIVDAFDEAQRLNFDLAEISSLACSNEALINPSLWQM